ncbi:Uncharacterised protein [Escherichia coli]|uniref:Uncharacterized protein n=1 Tax=Escherichia coli TaxID=562 RepID=A0A376TLX7_ECOLX|nr:Uncharacterised protein [Escherichia coli]
MLPDEQVETLVWNEWQKTGVNKLDSPEALTAMMANGPRTRSVADGYLEPAAPVDSGEAAA